MSTPNRTPSTSARAPSGRKAMSPMVILAILAFAALVLVGAIALARSIEQRATDEPISLGSDGRYALAFDTVNVDGSPRPFAGSDLDPFSDAILLANQHGEYGPVMSVATSFEGSDGNQYQVISLPPEAGPLIGVPVLESDVLYTYSISAKDQSMQDVGAPLIDGQAMTLTIPVISEFSSSGVISKDRFDVNLTVSASVDERLARQFTSEAPITYAFVSGDTYLTFLDRMFPSSAEHNDDVLSRDQRGELGMASLTKGAVAFFGSYDEAISAARSLKEAGFE